MALERTGLDIIIRTPADLSGAKAAEDQLAKTTRQAAALGGKLDEIVRQVPGLGQFAQIFNQLGAGGLGAAAASITAIGGALALAAKGVQEFAQAEERVAGLDQALARAGQLTDDYRERLQDLAGELQRTTGVADDEWIDVLRRLTQFGSNPQSIGMDVEAVKNLAGIVGSVSAAAQLYSKALQGNYEAFSRYGIAVAEAGTQTERLATLQEQLAQRGGGQLEAMNRTLSGQFRDLKNNVADLFEAIGRGEAKTGILQDGLYGLSESARWLAANLGGAVPQVEGLMNATSKAAPDINAAAIATRAYAEALDAATTAAKANNTALTENLTALKNIQKEKDEQTDSDLALAQAKINDQEARGKLTPEKAIRARAASRISFENKRRLEANALDREQLGLLDGATDDQLRRRDETTGAVDEARRNVFLVGDAERKEKAAGAAKDKYRRELQEYQELKQKLDEVQSGTGTTPFGADSLPMSGKELSDRIAGQGMFVEKFRRKSLTAGAAARTARGAVPANAPATSAAAQDFLKQAAAAAATADADSISQLHNFGSQRDEVSGGIENRNRRQANRDRLTNITAGTDAFKAGQVAMEQEWNQMQEAMKEYDNSNRRGMGKFTELLKRLNTRNFEQQ